jgi:predicted nucleic acid-binding protein
LIEYLRDAGDGLVLVDTSVWVTSTHRPSSAVADELRLLISRDRVACTEVVIAEILQCATNETDFEKWSDRLDALHFFPAGLAIWRTAGRISFDLRTLGATTPLTDLVVAAVALANDLPLYAVDEHFSRVPGLRLHTPHNYVVHRKPGEPEATDDQ